MTASVFIHAAERDRRAGRWREAGAYYLLAAGVIAGSDALRWWYVQEACAMHDRAQADERRRRDDPRRA